MVTAKELINFLETIAPPYLAEEYDNVGLLIGDKNKEINTVLITLDADQAVAEEARVRQADLVLSHHPLIFAPLKRITGEDGLSKTIMDFIKNDIALYAMHTNYDSVQGGLGDLFLDTICKSTNRAPLEGDGKNGIGRIADLVHPMTLKALLEDIQTNFSMQNVRYVGAKNKTIRKLAVVNGGGAEYVYCAKEQGADCFISGDIKYHQARFAYENDLAMIEIPHYVAEFMFCQQIQKRLKAQFGDKLNVIVTEKNKDIWQQTDCKK